MNLGDAKLSGRFLSKRMLRIADGDDVPPGIAFISGDVRNFRPIPRSQHSDAQSVRHREMLTRKMGTGGTDEVSQEAIFPSFEEGTPRRSNNCNATLIIGAAGEVRS